MGRRLLLWELCFILVAVIVIDVLVGACYPATPSFEILPTTSSSDTNLSASNKKAVLFLPGILARGSASVAPIAATLRDQADVVVVNYATGRHNTFTIISTIYAWLLDHGYRRVTVVGQSMGGNLAVALIDYNRRQQVKLSLRVILHDTPAGQATLVQGNYAWIAKLFHPGPLFNLLSRPFWKLAAQLHKPAQIEPGANLEQIQAVESAMTHYPLSGYTGQVRYVASAIPPQPGAYADTPAAILVSDGKGAVPPGNPGDSDGVVRHPVSRLWKAAFRPVLYLEVRAAHVDCAASPKACNQAYAKAFAALGDW